MFSNLRTTALSLALLSLATTSQTAPASSTFILPTGNKNFTFALNIPADSQDLYFHLSGPTSNSWIAIGTGNEMKDSLMILVYQNSHANNITVSPRLCSGNVEPVYEPNLDVDVLPGSGIFHDTYVLNGRCENCRKWKTGALDLTSTAQDWIYAFGPGVSMKSDSKTVSIERHSEYGRFTINMQQAIGTAGIPTELTRTSGATEEGALTQDSNWPSIIHAIAMSGSFILLMPVGVIFLRILERVRWHWMNQFLAMAIALIGTGLGLYLASMFNKSKNYNSTHQIIGLLVGAGLLVQFFLGYWHHRLYKQAQKTTVYAPIHRYLGQVLIVTGVVNGGIGLTWSRASNAAIVGYSIGTIIVVLLTVVPVGWKRFSQSRKRGGAAAFRTRRRSVDGQGSRVEGPWDDGSSRSQSDVHLSGYATPERRPEDERDDLTVLGYDDRVRDRDAV